MAVHALQQLEALRDGVGAAVAAQRLPLLRQLERTVLLRAAEVLRLHEALCFLRAYPGSRPVLVQVERMLAGFDGRADLRRHRGALAGSGIAGTAIHERFFGGQAQWLAARWPDRLVLDRSDAEADARLGAALPQLLSTAEADALIELKAGGYAALDRVRGATTDATFWLRRVAALSGGSLVRESLSDAVDASFVLQPGADTPSRTAACLAQAPRARDLAAGPPRGRPDLRAAIPRPPQRVRRLAVAAGRQLADLAQAAMVTRSRSLEAFSYADPRDAWLVDDGDGLAYGFLGMQPGRRHALATLVGGLTLRNRVPIGYLQADIVGACAALSFNTFDTFRGGEAAHALARWLAALHHLYGTTAFTVDPYQLGLGNHEGLASGAWWFYYKLGFRPRDRVVQRQVRDELARLARRPGQRSGEATLRALAVAPLFFELDAARRHPLPPLPAIGLAAGAALSARAGADRERAVAAAGAELLRRCGVASFAGFTRDERDAWHRMAPVITMFELESWPAAERTALVELVRSKGWRSEREHVARLLAHPRYEAALLALPKRR